MTDTEVIDWFMRWAAESQDFQFQGKTWGPSTTDVHPRWRVFKFCELACGFKPEDLTPEALAALAVTVKQPAENFPDWWPDGDWAHQCLSHQARMGRPLGLDLWMSGWRKHRQDAGGMKREDKGHLGKDLRYEPPYHKLGVPKGI